MKLSGRTIWIGVATFIVSIAVFALLFVWAMDRSIGESIPLSIAPAAISTGAIVWQYRDR